MTALSGKGKRVRKDAGEEGDEEEEEGQEDEGEEDAGISTAAHSVEESADNPPLSKRARREQIREMSQYEVSAIPEDQRENVLPLAELAVAPECVTVPVAEKIPATTAHSDSRTPSSSSVSSSDSESSSDVEIIKTTSHAEKEDVEGEEDDSDEEGGEDERSPRRDVPVTPGRSYDSEGHLVRQKRGGRADHELSQPLCQVELGEQFALRRYQPDFELPESEFTNMGYQRIGEAITFLAVGDLKRQEERARVADGLREELGKKDERVAEMTRELQVKDDTVNELKERVAGLETSAQARDSELASVRAELASLRAERDTLAEAKSMYKRIAIVNTSSGFETFREVARQAYPKEDWSQFEFDEGICCRIAEAKALDPDLEILPTPPSSP